jgi:hypothetical protein
MLTTLFAFLMVIHALIHLMGTAKGLQRDEVPQRRQVVLCSAAMPWLLVGDGAGTRDRSGALQKAEPRENIKASRVGAWHRDHSGASIDMEESCR